MGLALFPITSTFLFLHFSLDIEIDNNDPMGTSILIKYELNVETKSTKFLTRLNVGKKGKKRLRCYLEIYVFHPHVDSGFTHFGHGGNTGKERNSREDGKLIIGHSESRRQCSLPYVTLGKKTGDSDA